MTALLVRNLTVDLGGQPVLKGVDLDLAAGSYGVVLGPSGVGKSTLLRAIAGLTPAMGTIVIGDRTVCGGTQVVPPERRGVGFLFQGLALWPHMTASGHLRYALKGVGVPASEQAARIGDTLGRLGISNLAGRRPGELSGGERQRLALARCLVIRPAMLLLDEPTSSVDPTTARDVIGLLAEINREQATTILHVTHDQEQALDLALRVFVMAEGRILQSGTPEDVYSRPADLAVARFIGEGGLIQATLNGDVADTPLGSMPVDSAGLEGPVWVLVRPEHLEETSPGDGIPATTERVSYRGGDYLAHVRVADLRLAVPLNRRALPGETIRLRVVGVPRAVEARR